MTLLEWIKANSKEGADIKQAEELIKDLDPLKNIKTQEEALQFIDRNQVFKSALDSETSRRVERHDDKFKKEKLPSLLETERERALKELNPELTPDQKELAEIKRKMADRDRRDAERDLQDRLRQKAKELGYDPLRAERLYIHGDDAEKALLEEKEYFDNAVKAALEQKLKGQYTTTQPDSSSIEPAKTMARGDFDKLSASEKSAFVRDGGKPID